MPPMAKIRAENRSRGTSMDTLRSFEAKVDDVDKEDRHITFRINTDDIDSHGTVISPNGIRWERYRAMGGPVLWHHGQDPLRGFGPIGKNKWVNKYGKQRVEVRARDEFLKDDFSQQAYEWYRDGVLTGVSIRFHPPQSGDYGPPTNEEIRARPELEPLREIWRESQGQRGWILRSWDLAEHSCTPLPSNPMTFSVERSLQLLECCRSGLWLPDDVKAELEAKARTTTDSMGGLAGGGGTVKPNHEGGDKPDEDEDEETKKKRLAAEADKDKEKEPARSAPHVIEEGGCWHVMDGGKRSLSFADPELADECVRVMTAAPAFDMAYQLQGLLGEMRADHQELMQIAREYVDLYTRGRI